MTHSKGPWKRSEWLHNESVPIFSAGGELVAEIPTDPFQGGEEQKLEENIRLIESAPRLLEICALAKEILWSDEAAESALSISGRTLWTELIGVLALFEEEAPLDAGLFECLQCYNIAPLRIDYPNLRLCTQCCQTPADVGYGCPNCGWQCDSIDHDENAPVTYRDKRADWEYGCLGGAYWTEDWTCPECQMEFEQENGSV